MARFLVLIATWLTLAVPQLAHAHFSTESEVVLSPTAEGLWMEANIPAGNYALASSNPADSSANARERARRYLEQRIAIHGEGGEPWSMQVESVDFITVPAGQYLTARLSFDSGEQSRDRATLQWSPVVENTSGHLAVVFVEDGGSKQLIGAARQGGTSVPLDLSGVGAWARFTNAVGIGAAHIADGYDHLLFLIALLLSAPLVAQGGRWVGFADTRRAVIKLAGVVSGFTIGHSATLVLVTLSGLSLPSAPVEIAIAFSVLLTAVHVIRPLFPGREMIVATVFGLVHGMAFATLLSDFDQSMAGNLPALAGFNVGIELMQLAVIAAAVPLLVWLSSKRHFPVMRRVAGVMVAACGSYWVVERMAPALI